MNQKQQKDEVYEAMLQERIGQALREQQDAKLDLQVLDAWAEERRMRKRRQRRRYALIACCVLLICAGALALRFAVPSGSDVSMAKKSGDTVKETDGGAVIKDNQADAEENVGDVKITIDDWEKVYDAQKEHPDMLVPEYVPEGYVFEKLVIEGNALTEKYRFFFSSKGGKIEISNSSGKDETSVFDYDEELNVDNRKVLLNTAERIVYCRMGEINIIVTGIVDMEEIEQLVNGLNGVN